MPTGQYPRVPAHRRFLSKVRTGENCWEWIGAIGTHGYGRFGVDNKTVQAHRFMFELVYSRIPFSEIDVCHRCDNKKCVRPDHLFLGTRKDNMRDCSEKKRNRFGESHPSARLSAAQVVEIREQYASGNTSQAELGRRYGVDSSNISRIVNLKSRIKEFA